MPDPLLVVALLFAVLGLLFLFVTIALLRKRKYFRTLYVLMFAFLMLSLSALFSTVIIAVQGYRALTREDLAATIKVEPAGPQRFIARFRLPDGSERTFSISGDELYVDAHILKWKPVANIFGLHTSYELDRVAGRYAILGDETRKPHTVYSLARDKPLDMFHLRRRFAVLTPLLDAEYGSATFIKSDSEEAFKLTVSTTGLVIRKIGKTPGI